MQKTSTKGIQELVWLGRIAKPLGIVQEIKIYPCCQVIYTQTRLCPGKGDTKFSVTNGSRNHDQTQY